MKMLTIFAAADANRFSPQPPYFWRLLRFFLPVPADVDPVVDTAAPVAVSVARRLAVVDTTISVVVFAVPPLDVADAAAAVRLLLVAVETAVVACDENIMISLLIINRWLEMDNRETVFSADNIQSLVAVAGTGTPPAGPWLCCGHQKKR